MSKILNLIVKTLDLNTIELEIEESELVRELKRILYEKHDIPISPEQQYLTYAGRVLLNDDALSEYDIDERKYLLVMLNPILKKPTATVEIKTHLVSVLLELDRKLAEQNGNQFFGGRIMRNNRTYQDAFREARIRPERIGNILYRIGREDPQLFEYLRNNLDEMLYLLGLPKRDISSSIVNDFLSPAERLAIKRLRELGFKLDNILKVYFKFNKDEQKTADYLFKGLEEDNSES